MKKPLSARKSKHTTEGGASLFRDFPDREILERLEKAVEDHLPGDFSTWEEDQSVWTGRAKTVDGTQRNPGSGASAWGIYTAHKLGEEAFGFADQAKDETALLQLEDSLAQGLGALRSISVWTAQSLSKGSFEKMSGVVGAPADLVFVTCAAALQDGIDAARKVVASEGTPSSKEKRRAAAVVGECREIYAARTVSPAPEWALDRFLGGKWNTDRKGRPGEDITEFVHFAKAIFKVLSITVRVDSALRVWRKHSTISQISAGPMSPSED